jgi:hypothetical protein
MEKIRYPIDWRVSLLGITAVIIGFTIAIISNPTHPELWKFLIIFAVFLIFVATNYTIGTYGFLDKESGMLSRTDYLFYTKRLSVKEIKTIYYRPTWIIGGLTRSLYILDVNEKTIEFPNVGWHESVLAKIAGDLRTINPSIKLDKYTEELLKKYSK